MLIQAFQFQVYKINLEELIQSNDFRDNLKKGLDLFNSEKFWDCHEELEDHWLEANTDLEKYLYWVVIQVATVNFHYLRENFNGAHGLLAKSKKKVQKIKQLTNDEENLNQILDWNELVSLLDQIRPDDQLEKFSPLYKFKFKKFYEEL